MADKYIPFRDSDRSFVYMLNLHGNVVIQIFSPCPSLQYKPDGDGLEELLRRRKNLVDGIGTSDELMSPEGDSSCSGSEFQSKKNESKDDQLIHVRCIPTPPPKPRGNIVHNSSKDDTVSLHSKGLLDENSCIRIENNYE